MDASQCYQKCGKSGLKILSRFRFLTKSCRFCQPHFFNGRIGEREGVFIQSCLLGTTLHLVEEVRLTVQGTIQAFGQATVIYSPTLWGKKKRKRGLSSDVSEYDIGDLPQPHEV